MLPSLTQIFTQRYRPVHLSHTESSHSEVCPKKQVLPKEKEMSFQQRCRLLACNFTKKRNELQTFLKGFAKAAIVLSLHIKITRNCFFQKHFLVDAPAPN